MAIETRNLIKIKSEKEKKLYEFFKRRKIGFK